ncbi:hypothetical protein AGMMS49938_01310 [Fibrobacterales bacterium]|nr:hypothetical protein AGMMS49938_01310 [Fibrobacterales bacterium]
MKALVLTFILAVAAFAGPVSQFGYLQACQVGGKGQLCGSKTGNSTAIFVKGPSLYWSIGKGVSFYSGDVVDWFVDNMQIGVIRAAMAIRYLGENTGLISESGSAVLGYYDDKVSQKAMIKEVIDAAIVNDIYVIVDWHSHNAQNETSLATTFFTEIANEYKDVPNIIWEVYNEPVGASNSQINTHANAIITALRNAGNNNLVLIGSPQWSQNASGQASSWGTAANAITKNVGFVFHFYAGSHSDIGGFGANSAMSSGYAVFGTEWGAVNANGDGGVATGTSDSWTTWMDNNKVSNCMWNVSDLDEGSSMFSEGTSTADLSTNKLTASGKYFQTYMGKNKWTAQIPTANPKAGDYTGTVKDGASVTITATQLGIDGTISEVSTPSAGTAEIEGTGIKYTTPASGSPAKVRFNYFVTKNSVTVQGRITINITDLKPSLPQVEPISVSKKAATKLSLVNQLKATAPKNDVFTLQSVTVSDEAKGTAVKIAAGTSTGDTILFTPSAAMATVESEEVVLTYTVKNNAGVTSTATVTLILQNIAPTLPTATAYCVVTLEASDNIAGLGLTKQFAGKDKDGDSIWFDKFYLSPDYPGELKQVAVDSLVYDRKGSTAQGKVIILAVATDGSLQSNLGKVCVTLKGSGATISVTPPTEIPGYVPVALPAYAKGLNAFEVQGRSLLLHSEGSLEIYTLKGKRVSLSSVFAGSQISLQNLPSGAYIAVLRNKSATSLQKFYLY